MNIGTKRRVPGLIADIQKLTSCPPPGVIDQNIDVSELVHTSLDQCLHLIFFGDIALLGNHLDAGLGRQLGSFLQQVHTASRADQEVSAFLSEGDSAGTPVIAGCPGNQYNLSCQASIHVSSLW